MPALFDRFAFEPRAVARKKAEPDWLTTLRTRDDDVTTVIGGFCRVLVGDPHDGLPLEPARMRWGMPNPWMAQKGLDPLLGSISFMSIEQAFAKDQAIGGRTLVPVTSVGGPPARYPPTSLVTLAALYRSAEEEPGQRGFCLLAEGAAVLFIQPQDRERWMDGWASSPELRSLCCRWEPRTDETGAAG